MRVDLKVYFRLIGVNISTDRIHVKNTKMLKCSKTIMVQDRSVVCFDIYMLCKTACS